MELFTKTWAEISLDNLRYNYENIRRQVGPGCKIMGVVKADAYGHGAVQVSRLLEKLGAGYLAVSSLDEAMQLREAGITLPILILGWTPPELAPVLLEHQITQAVFSLGQAEALSGALPAGGGRLKVHIKLDTGMSRLGFPAQPDQVSEILGACELKNLEPEGIFTHFAVSDVPGESYTQEQFDSFLEIIQELEVAGLQFPLRHCANSGAIVNSPEMCLNMVRPGIILYGLRPDRRALPFDLRPVMAFKTTVSQVRTLPPGRTVSYGRTWKSGEARRIAVLCAGYADGLMRVLSGKLRVKIGDRFYPQVGRICMDMCMADVTGGGVREGEAVTLFGEDLPVEDLAEAAGTISYEIVCQISKRVPRKYFFNGQDVGSFSYLHPEHSPEL